MRALKIRARAAELILIPEDESKKLQNKRFVEHLVKIAVDPDILEDAFDDYYRFITERIRLLEEGYVTKEDWSRRENNLVIRWKHILSRNMRTLSDKHPCDVGVATFEETIDHREPLAGEFRRGVLSY